LVVDPRAAGEVAQEQLAPLINKVVGWCVEENRWVIAVRRVNEREKRGLEAKKREEGGGRNDTSLHTKHRSSSPPKPSPASSSSAPSPWPSPPRLCWPPPADDEDEDEEEDEDDA